jgi:hypothetical protein
MDHASFKAASCAGGWLFKKAGRLLIGKKKGPPEAAL